MLEKAAESLVRIGCSGWVYKDWRGKFYPERLPQARWLEYYASQFNTVEINSSFYRLPEAAVFRQWRRQMPRGFECAVKASRFLTHMKKLNQPYRPIQRLLSRARHLDEALGPVLFQLPPRWSVNPERLQRFLDVLPRARRYAIDFRDPSWYTDQVFAALKRAGVAVCLHDLRGSASGRLVTAPFVYVRFHGTSATTKYSGSYSDRVLDDWAAWLTARVRAAVQVYAYFNNDIDSNAPRDALRLRRRILAHVLAGRSTAAR